MSRPRAWILAGGLSSRFGSDKALHVLDGETLLARTARVCTEAGLDVVVVARHERPGGLTTLVEPDGPRHPLHGVATALGAAAARGDTTAVVLPVDLPELTEAAIRALVAAPAPTYAAGQRLLAHLPASAASAAAEGAARGGRVAAFLEGIAAAEVEVGEVGNLNRLGG